LITVLGARANGEASIQTLSTKGGSLALTFYRGNLRDSGLKLEGTSQQDYQHDTATLDILPDGHISYRAVDGYFTNLEDGFLPLDAGLKVSFGNLGLDSAQLRLKPRQSSRDTLLISDQSGTDWFYLDYGHYERLGQRLYARFLDIRISEELARQLGDPLLDGYVIGFATLETNIETPDGEPLGFEEACPVDSPNWPTLDGYESDIAMLKLPVITQVAREDGRVAIATSAYFENIGNADIPWFAQFADSRNVDACCADEGDGPCAPYANDQGGMLVYALYRFVEGRLEQLGQSQVKHAFNSVNLDTPDGSLACRAADRGGRVIPTGCEDLYQVGTNANQWFLGPRDEVIAHKAVWLRAGSIWDQTGPAGEPDGNCDFMPENLLFGGQVPCKAPSLDVMDRRLSVAEHALETPGARYFIEAWYLARDDVNVLNSFGHKEVNPVFTTTWTFPPVAPFQQGPVIEEHKALQGADAGDLISSVETTQGQLRIASSVSMLETGTWQYDISLMNIDFDRAVNGFDIPIPDPANLSLAVFFDGDSDTANDWAVTTPPGILRFQAPENISLKWGSMVSFRFIIDREPVVVNASLMVANEGTPSSLSGNILGADRSLFKDGFE
jgi:hypothetical protein